MNTVLCQLLLAVSVLVPGAHAPGKGVPGPEGELLLVSFDQTILVGDTLHDGGLLIRIDGENSVAPGPPFGLVVDADLDAYDVTGLLSFDRSVELAPGFVAGPGDLVQVDGDDLRLLVDAARLGLPEGVKLDAASVTPEGIAVSFDQTVQLGKVVVADEDLVTFDPGGDGGDAVLLFDGDAAGIDAALDLDAAHVLASGRILLSFDQSGALPAGLRGGPVYFGDKSVLSYSPRTSEWTILADFAALNEVPGEYDLDALSATIDLIFQDGFE